uniref:CARD domain-containing protein n=1 Tax=Scleropages formosus TaxID=113540 RepID=A0A8C9QZ54_SCLFO
VSGSHPGPASTELAEFVDEHNKEIIQRVKKVQQIADKLRSQGIISDAARRRILVTGTSEEGMSELYRSLKRGGAKAKSTFYWLLQQFKPALIAELPGEEHAAPSGRAACPWCRRRPGAQ